MMKLFTRILLFTLISLSWGSSLLGQTFEVVSPSSVAGEYPFGVAFFGLQLTSPCADFDITANLAAGLQENGVTTGCDAQGEITSDVSGKVAVVDRGNCNFTEKVLNAQNAGALAVLICNNDQQGDVINMDGEADNITIPAIMLSFGDCASLRALPEYEAGEVQVLMRDNSGQFPEDEFASEQPLWETKFANGLDGWTSTSVLCNGAESENAQWEWVPEDNFARGGFGLGARLFSFSPCDGAAMFDSDFLDNAGDDSALGSGPCPSTQEAYLTSPEIDLSAYSFEGIPVLKFTNMFRQFNSVYFVEWSTDGGQTWSEKTLNGDAEQNSAHIVNIQRVLLNDVDVNGTVTFRFRIEGDYYYWGIDDVKIVDFSGTNARIFETFYTPLSYAVPQSHADADTFFFATNVINESPSPLTSVKLDVEVINDGSGNVVYSNSATIQNVAPTDTASIFIDDVFVPNMLDIGVYRIEYNISLLDQTEDISTDNTDVFFFEITENTFAKENGATTAFNPNLAGNWFAGALYKLSPNVENVEAVSATIGIESNGDILTDNYIDVYLLKLNAGIYENFNDQFDFDDTNIFAHPSFELVTQTTHLFSNELPGDLITIPIIDGEESFPLETGAAYIVLVGFDEGQEGVAQVPNNELFVGYSEDIQSVGFSDFIVDPAGGWFTGFPGDPAPVIRLNIEAVSSANEILLPEAAFQITPNPANNLVRANIELEEATDASLVITSLDGRVLFTKHYQNVVAKTEEINVSQLQSGTYLIQIKTKAGSRTQKLIVQH